MILVSLGTSVFLNYAPRVMTRILRIRDAARPALRSHAARGNEGNSFCEARALLCSYAPHSSLYISIEKHVIPAGIAGIQVTWTYTAGHPWYWIPASRRAWRLM